MRIFQQANAKKGLIVIRFRDLYRAISNVVAAHLDRKSISEHDEIYAYIISFVATIFALAVHVFLLATFLFEGEPVFIIMNIVSTCLYLLLLYVHKKRKYKLLAVVISVDVSLYATITLVLTGLSTYIVGYYLLAILLQIILPYESLRYRTFLVCAILVVGCCAIVYSMEHEAMILHSAALNRFLTYANIAILYMGTIVQLCLGNIIRNLIEKINEIRLSDMTNLANTDPLTGLFNRRYAETYFTDILKHRKARPHCIAMLDIDNFKLVNDTYGHGCGDEVLVYLADFIKSNLRRTDLVFRWGGEEFLLVLDDVDLPVAYNILDKLRVRLAESVIKTSVQNLHITVTIGLTVLNSEDHAGSIETSDQNLYIGKQKEKNVVIAG